MSANKVFREVKPILSLDRTEARRKVIALYKAWYRQIPFIVTRYDTEYTEEMCRDKLREEFTKYDEIHDIRIIDMLVIRGQMELHEAIEKWTSRRGITKYFNYGTIEPKPTCFLDKFLTGKD